MSATAEPLSKHASASRTYGFDFSPLLKSGEILSGTPTVTITPAGELEASGAQVNSSQFDDPDGNTSIAATKGVTALFSGGESGTEYSVEVSCGIDGKSETLAVTVPMSVVG